MPDTKIHIGVDIGSVSLKMAVYAGDDLDLAPLEFLSVQLSEYPFWLSPYMRHQGAPYDCFRILWNKLEAHFPKNLEFILWMTGRGGKTIARRLNVHYIQEFQAVAEGVGRLYPDVQTIFEMGGETAKYLQIHHENGQIQIADYDMNGDCAAGTGLFFDQQANRLKYAVEDVGEVIQSATRSASIAGRCSVFAKSDMIHAQQRGYQPNEILKGLCEAVVRNYKGTVTKGKDIRHQVAFIGGLAANSGVAAALKPQFGFTDDELIIPEQYAWMTAIGAALYGARSKTDSCSHPVFHTSRDAKRQYPSESPLNMDNVVLLRNETVPFQFPESGSVDAYLGIDIGSVSTNLALITPQGDLIYGIYTMTEGRPIDIVQRSLLEMQKAVNNRVNVIGIGTTGSGRELIGLLVGADVIKDEITAHKMGAMHISQKYLGRPVDTIFEIGGQDSKFISLKDNTVVDFALNDACAAGTGSFLEEQAQQIGIQIKEEFARLALQSEHPLKLGERCTVFMEKEMIPYLRQGIPKKDIVAGLAISVVHNYLNRVVKKRVIGDRIFFQGGTAYNDAVAAAFSTVLNRQIVVPPHNGIMGAIGAALLAKSSLSGKTAFHGWDLSRVHWNLREFTCQACSNSCVIQEFNIEGEKSYWGDKCSDRYRKRLKSKNIAKIPDLFQWRIKQTFSKSEKFPESMLGTIGIPRVLQMYDRYPFWKAYFNALGYKVFHTDFTHQDTVKQGLEATVAEPCFPVQVSHGHLIQLLKQEVDYVFLPNLVDETSANPVASFICPWAQTSPIVAQHSPMLHELNEKLLCPNIQFRLPLPLVENMIFHQIRQGLPVKRKQHRDAFYHANEENDSFRKAILEKGQPVIEQVVKDQLKTLVLVGRPYNLYDSGLNLNIPEKLRNVYGMNVIPMDFLPTDGVDVSKIHDHMFWNYGYKILQAARWVRDYPNLQVIYLSNFKCGPDSYIRHYIEEALGRPFLFLQLDSHSNDAGIMTRIEAFLESKGMI